MYVYEPHLPKLDVHVGLSSTLGVIYVHCQLCGQILKWRFY